MWELWQNIKAKAVQGLQIYKVLQHGLHEESPKEA